MHTNRTHLKRIFFIGSTLLLVFYAYIQTRTFFSGPQLHITSVETPDQHSAYTNIHGTAERISHLTLNGQHIFITTEGVFDERVFLLSGYNVITVVAYDRFGRTVSEKRTLYTTPRTL
jgi:hypothetical protein